MALFRAIVKEEEDTNDGGIIYFDLQSRFEVGWSAGSRKSSFLDSIELQIKLWY